MELIPNQTYFHCDSSLVMTSRAMMQTINACIVSTKNYVFVIPQKTIGFFVVVNTIKTHHLFSGVSVEQGVKNLVAQCKTVEELENTFLNLLEGQDIYIYKISELTSFKFKGFLGKHTVRMGKGWGWTSVTVNPKAASKAFRTFHGQ